VRDLCYVQWDPIDAVAPSHVISFWSRLGDYRVFDLDRLLWDEKRLFLHWYPASFGLTSDYPLYLFMMKRFPESLSKSWGGQKRRAEKFLAEHKPLRAKILAELKKRGPLLIRQFQDHVPAKSPDLWTSGGKVANMVYYLTLKGEVMVVGHSGNQNIWGLAEKFLPDWVDRKELSEDEFERQAAQRALRALGIATPREIHIYFPRGRYLHLDRTLEHLEEESKIHRVQVEGIGDKHPRYVHDSDIRLMESIEAGSWEPRMTILAPFDNMICLRSWTNRLFGFDYVHENFLPESKRKFGTFVHPILWGDTFIGRVDMRLDKKNHRLDVISVHAERNAPAAKEVGSMVGETVGDFASFLGARDVAYSDRVPAPWKSRLH
jgi:uncharacterized protein